MDLFGNDEPGGVDIYGYPIARTTDRETSHESARRETKKLKTHQAMFMTALSGLGEATANEVAERACRIFQGVMHETVRKRAKELERLGRIVAVGKRRCRCSGSSATVWRKQGERSG